MVLLRGFQNYLERSEWVLPPFEKKKTAKRWIRVEEHLKFNEIWLKEDLLPRYTNFNIYEYNRAAWWYLVFQLSHDVWFKAANELSVPRHLSSLVQNIYSFLSSTRFNPRVGDHEVDLVNRSFNAFVKKTRLLSFVKTTRHQSDTLSVKTHLK